jgi:hypothetical protein
MFILFLFLGFGLGIFGLLFGTAKKNLGLLYLLMFPLAIILLPFKLASDMMGGTRRKR